MRASLLRAARLAVGVALASSCTPTSSVAPACPGPEPKRALEPPRAVVEVPVRILALAGPVSASRAELSGLAWSGDDLVLLPQYPSRFGENGNGALFALEKKVITDDLDGVTHGKLTPRALTLVAPGHESWVESFDGFEAIAFAGPRVFLTMETKSKEHTGYVVSGTREGDSITLDRGSIVKMQPPMNLPNMGFEAMIVTGDRVRVLFEANGVGGKPLASCFGLDLSPTLAVSVFAIPFRVTDATSVDAQGNFWVTNFFWPGDRALAVAHDPIAERDGQGPTHKLAKHVERLVQLKVDASGIVRTDAPALQLQLGTEARNWEGIARLEGRGFLLVNDEHPSETVVGFVPYPSP